MKRVAQVIGLRPGCLEEYTRYHRQIWPEVAAKLKECGIRNYSIHYREGMLFSYFEYSGEDYPGDMKKLAENPANIRWREIMSRMQIPLESRAPGEHWAGTEELFFLA